MEVAIETPTKEQKLLDIISEIELPFLTAFQQQYDGDLRKYLEDLLEQQKHKLPSIP